MKDFSVKKKVSSIKELKKRHDFLCDRLLDYIIKDDMGNNRGVELLHDILCADDDFKAGVREQLNEIRKSICLALCCHADEECKCECEFEEKLRRILSVRTPLTEGDKT